MDLVRRPVAQAFARPAVELIVHLLHALLADAPQRLALREVLAQQAVGVLVGAALPRVVRKSEVELDADLLRDLGVGRELLAPVEGHRLERLALEGLRHLGAHACRGLAPALPADEEAVPAVDEGQQARAAGPAGDRVPLPVPGLGAAVGGRGALGYLVRDLDLAAPLRRSLAALPAMAQPLGRLSAADARIEAPRPYGAVDGRVAHGAGAQLEREPALDLLGRPLLVQELVPDQREHGLVIQYRGPAARESALGVAPLRRRRAVEALARVARELARDGRLVPADRAGDLAYALAVSAHHHDVLALA